MRTYALTYLQSNLRTHLLICLPFLFTYLLQSRFDELWRKYITYSGGEQLFGLPVTDYPELARTKKELGLLQKLYGLYNAVIDGVNGYYDILWIEVDIEKINNELLDFQNRYVCSITLTAFITDS